MTWFQALILGVVQGLCEFLPISSSGHLVLLQKVFNINEGALSFDIIVHLATLIALCAVMRKRLAAYLRNPFGHIPRMVVLGTVPTAVIALVFSKVFKDMFDSGMSLGIGFIYTAVILYLAQTHSDSFGDGGSVLGGGGVMFGRNPMAGGGGAKFNRGAARGMKGADAIDIVATEQAVTPKGALIVGIAQGIAIIPAVSRSGSTVAGGIMSNFGKTAAVEFAFLMSIPITLLAVAQDVLEAIKNKGAAAAGAVAAGALAGTADAAVGAAGAAGAVNAAGAAGAAQAIGFLEIAVGFAAAAVTGYFAARFMLTAIKKIKLTWFSLYVGVLGILILADQLVFGIVFDKFIR